MANIKNGKEIKVSSPENNDNSGTGGLDKKYKLIATFALFYCSLCYGLTTYIIGPALNDMQIKLDTTTDMITIVFGCMLLGYTTGAIVNGIIYNFINRQLVMAFLLCLMACAISFVPHCTKLGLLFVVSFFTGSGGGGFDTAQVVWTIELWGEKSSLYLQGIQFFFALGTFVSPLISRPFLAQKLEPNETVMDTTISTTFLAPNVTNIAFAQNVSNTERYGESHIEIPFSIVGGFLLSSGILLVVLHLYRRYVPPVEQNDDFVCKCPDKWRLIFIILGLFTLAPYVGMEVMNFQLMPTFAKDSHLQLSGSDSALVQSIMAGSFTLLRGICCIISIKFWSEKTIFLNIITIFVGNIIIFLYEFNEYSKTVLWIGAIIVGSGFSTVFASVYAFLETLFPISNAIGGLFVCTSGLMAAILPTLCGQFISTRPLTLIYFNFMCTSIIGISFTLLNIIIYSKSKTRKLSKF